MDEDNEEGGWEWGLYPCDGKGDMLDSTFNGKPMAWEPRILEDCNHRGVLKRLLMDNDSGMVVVSKHLMRSGGFGGERTKATSIAFYEPI